MERTLDEKLKPHVFSCFDEGDYMDLNKERIGYTNVTMKEILTYLYTEYIEKTEALQNKALDNLNKGVDISGPSIKPFKIKQGKLKLFLALTEQALPDKIYL